MRSIGKGFTKTSILCSCFPMQKDEKMTRGIQTAVQADGLGKKQHLVENVLRNIQESYVEL